MTDNSARTAAVIYNPVKVDLDKLRDTVVAAQADAGWAETLWFETTVDDVGQGVTREALSKDVDVVIVAGGDGTVRAVIEELRGNDVPVALVPSGTGNLLARNMKLPLNALKDSIDAAFNGAERKIDVGVISIEREGGEREENAFVVMAGLGLDAKMITNTDDDLKAKAGWAAYVKALAASLRDPGELHMKYRLDDGPVTKTTLHTLIIGNCGSLPANILLMPDALVDDGLFDVMMTRPKTSMGWIRVWFTVAWTNGVLRRSKAGRAITSEGKKDGDLHYQTGTQLKARFTEPEDIELDGDGFGKATGFKAWLEPLSISVKVPA